jgi:hypothetical protein
LDCDDFVWLLLVVHGDPIRLLVELSTVTEIGRCEILLGKMYGSGFRTMIQ